VRTEGLDKCYTNEEAAEATCPDEKTAQFKDIILYSKLPASLAWFITQNMSRPGESAAFRVSVPEKFTFLFDGDNLLSTLHFESCLVHHYKHA
jgi:hypothetical protein